ncbi:HIT family protein [Streptomyces sp. GLT-R25]
MRCEGVNLFLADGEAAFQEVFHVHLHVFPRFKGDPFRIDADWRVQERNQLDKTAAAVRSGLAALDAGQR